MGEEFEGVHKGPELKGWSLDTLLRWHRAIDEAIVERRKKGEGKPLDPNVFESVHSGPGHYVSKVCVGSVPFAQDPDGASVGIGRYAMICEGNDCGDDESDWFI